MIEPKWKYKFVDEECVGKLAKTFNLPNTIARIMSLRGIMTKEESKFFFDPNINNLHNPFKMVDMDKAVERVTEAITKKQTILILGDYDVDGVVSVAFLILFFRKLGIDSYYYIPNRMNEGYGISKKGIDYAKYIGADIIITCDCGVNAYQEVEYANENNIDIIITDHHKPNTYLPNAYAILNPKRNDCKYPFKGLCGSGIAFKFALAICKKRGISSDIIWENSDLITLGIVADLVPMQDENRIIAYHGIRRIIKGNNLGIVTLLKNKGLKVENISIGKLMFWIIPKINAMGRLGDASKAVKLLITKNPIYALKIAQNLEKENSKRRKLTNQAINEAMYMVNKTCNLKKENVIILGNNNWHPGIISIIATRIQNIFFRPVIIISMNKQVASGSCRSIKGFDILNALAECKQYLIEFGGHSFAAGFLIDRSKFDIFKKVFLNLANEKISNNKLKPVINIDSNLKLEDLNNRLLIFLNSLEPYGPGNRRPIFASQNLSIDGIPKLIGKSQDTLKFLVKDNETLIESIGFNMANHYEKLIQNSTIDIAYVIAQNTLNGKKIVQLELKDIKLSKNYA